MARYGYISGQFDDQLEIQEDILQQSGIDFTGGITVNMDWGDFLAMLQPGDEVVIVASSRISSNRDECKARIEMLELLGVTLHSLTHDGRED